MSEDMGEEEFQEAVAKYFPKCPLCGGKSLEFDVKFGRRYDRVICHSCNAAWEIDWKGEGFGIESIRLVEVRDVEKAGLKDEGQSPEFWQRMALQAKEAQPVARENEVTKKKACPSCRKDVSWLPADATNCPYCGATLEQLSEE